MQKQQFCRQEQKPQGNQSMELEQFQDVEEEDFKPAPGRSVPGKEIQVNWRDLMLRAELMRVLKQSKFDYPSEVQMKGIVQILSGKDLVCLAKSGTGKTAVFVLSILQLMTQNDPQTYNPHQCIVMVPTRELAHQILKQFTHFSKYIKPKINVSAFFGGIPIETNVTQLCNQSTSPSIIISTPGRLNDLYQRKYIILEHCKYFIIDECDKIIDNPKMRVDFLSVYQNIPLKKQVLMFSATLTPQTYSQIKNLTSESPVEIKIQEDYTILNRLTQFFLRIPQMDKYDKLREILDKYCYNQCIIFVNRIEKARLLVLALKQRFYNPICMNSSIKQEERIYNYDLLKQNSSKLVVATDIFGRGIDIDKVNLVINYDFPKDPETYLHRVGRAGRFGAKGVAINFVKIDDHESKGMQNQDDMVGIIKRKYNIPIKILPDRNSIVEYL